MKKQKGKITLTARVDLQEKEINNFKKKITANFDEVSRLVYSLGTKFRKLDAEWQIYESEYRKYLAKRDRLQRFLWWLCRKITFRSTRLTKKDVLKRTAKKMAHMFYEGGH